MIDWTALSSQLTTPVQVTDVNTWLEQCIRPFDTVTRSPVSEALGAVSNYELFDQSSGLCMQEASCAFTNCTSGPFRDTYEPFATLGGLPFYQSVQLDPVFPVLTDEEIIEAASLSEDSQLPAAVVHPEHPGDVSAAVRFAADNGIKISVKTSGHNWMGSSTRKGTLLLNLSKLRKYALPETLSDGIFECNPVEDGDDGGIVVVEPRMGTDEHYSSESVTAACKVALARGKPAIMRAGGGQIVDEGLRAVEEWNSDPSRPPLHAMTGAAGTVSLAGGWLASGGLGGPLNMRQYGVGVDNVLYAEMVLPDGQFVRFGPSTWTPAEGNQLYPQTTSVKGYCIANDTADLSDESTWSWVDCTDQYGFDDLWFAIRGGGGGNYGVITSIYYQLHDKPGNLQQVYWPETIFRILFDQSMSTEDQATMVSEIIKFVFNFLYNPDKVGVSQDMSNSCSAPEQGMLDCYNGAGQAFVDAWVEYFGMLETAKMIGGAAPTPRLEEYSSYAAKVAPSHFNGRVQDGPKGAVLYGGDNALVIPINVLQNKFDAFMDLFIPCVFDTIEASFAGTPETGCFGAWTPYFYGGDIQFASDGTDAYPPHRRNGAMHIYVLREDAREQFKKLIWDVEENAATYSNGDFPGLYCHNHLFYSTSPKKSNWLEDCIRSTPDGSGLTDDDCWSLQEAAFGTETLRRLEKIHSDIDPLRMFQTSDGPGYADGEGADTSSAGIYLTVISVFVTLSTTLVLI